MKSWRTRITCGLAVATAVVAVPLTAGSASAASWQGLAGGPAMYTTIADCEADIPRALESYQDARCVERENGINLEVLI